MYTRVASRGRLIDNTVTPFCSRWLLEEMWNWPFILQDESWFRPPVYSLPWQAGVDATAAERSSRTLQWRSAVFMRSTTFLAICFITVHRLLALLHYRGQIQIRSTSRRDREAELISGRGLYSSRDGCKQRGYWTSFVILFSLFLPKKKGGIVKSARINSRFQCPSDCFFLRAWRGGVNISAELYENYSRYLSFDLE